MSNTLKRCHIPGIVVTMLFVLGAIGMFTPTQHAAAQAEIVQCVGGPAEIVLVMDGSESLMNIQNTLRDFGNAFVSSFNVGATAVRFAIVGFDDNINVSTGLTGDLTTIGNGISGFYGGGQTNVAIGINAGSAAFGSARAGVPKVLVVLTDGGHNLSPEQDVTDAVNAAKALGAAVFAVAYDTGPGFTNTNVLQKIDPGYQLYAVSELVALVGNIVGQVCTTTGGTTTVVGVACLDVPLGSVVGELISQTEIFWAPGKISPGLSLQPGPDNKTYYVMGVDEAREFYKIRIACQYVWVPVGVMAPAFSDPVWQGTPLPTNVVE